MYTPQRRRGRFAGQEFSDFDSDSRGWWGRLASFSCLANLPCQEMGIVSRSVYAVKHHSPYQRIQIYELLWTRMEPLFLYGNGVGEL